jgi:hypothetical protein
LLTPTTRKTRMPERFALERIKRVARIIMADASDNAAIYLRAEEILNLAELLEREAPPPEPPEIDGTPV